MAGPAGDYHRGEMDIQEHVSTYKAFLNLSKWGSLIMAVGILFLALVFSTQTGVIGSAVTALVVFAIGYALLRSKPKASH